MDANIVLICGIVKRYFAFPKLLSVWPPGRPGREPHSPAIAAANHKLRCVNATGSSARMNRKQAAEVKRHLLNAGRALNRADFALFRLGKVERNPLRR